MKGHSEVAESEKERDTHTHTQNGYCVITTQSWLLQSDLRALCLWDRTTYCPSLSVPGGSQGEQDSRVQRVSPGEQHPGAAWVCAAELQHQ